MKIAGTLYFILVMSFCCAGQDADSSYVLDTTDFFTNYTEDQKDLVAPADSSRVEIRKFSGAVLNELKSDASLQYKEAPTVAESLWDRFLALLGQFFDALFRNAVTTDWGRFFSYIIGIAVLVVLIMMILRVNAFKVFYSGQGASTMPHQILDEDIHEMDFDLLIQDAIAQHDYRRGIRLLFLNGLKILADKNLIRWEQGKTNHDYLSELTAGELKEEFDELNYYFEYAWYGNFMVNHGTFLKVQDVFKDLKRRIQ